MSDGPPICSVITQLRAQNTWFCCVFEKEEDKNKDRKGPREQTGTQCTREGTFLLTFVCLKAIPIRAAIPKMNKASAQSTRQAMIKEEYHDV